MRDSRILSAFPDLPVQEPQARGPALVFDACHVGVILRAILFVEAVIAVGAMFGAANPLEWLDRLSLLSGGALPATLVWLVAACSLKRMLARRRPWVQRMLGVLLGALAGLYGCGVLALAGGVGSSHTPWVASAFAGVLFSAALVAALVWRAKGRMPADAAARLAELQARIQPHFLFNALNSAIALVRDDPARAESLLEDLADLFRHALVDHGEAVTLAQEVQLAQRYLDVEQVRFGDRLQVEWVIDPRAAGAKVPPLVLQPLVENAVKHGVEPSASGAQVRVSTERRGSTVVIKVTNTVPAGPGRPGNGLALHNVRDRVRLLHDVQGQIHWALKDGMYQVRLEVPV